MSWQIKAKNVIKVQVEVTNYCQARCPQCAREKLIGKDISTNESPYTFELNNSYVTLEQFKGWFDKDDWDDLKLIDICGSYDEPCTNPELLKIVEWIITSDLFNKNLQVNIATNGGVRDKQFWTKLGELTHLHRDTRGAPRIRVVWGIDGLEDTNHLYRRNVNWNKLQENFRTYIAAKGNAYWQFIYFKHNEHQDELVKQRSIDEGFSGIKWRGSKGRVKYNNKVNRAITDKKTGKKYEVKTSYSGKYEKPVAKPTREIRCKALKRLDYDGLESTLYISHQGWLLPCCWWGNKDTLNEVWEKYGKNFDVESHRLTGKNSVQDALDGEWFSNLHNHIMTEMFSECVSQCKENMVNMVNTQSNRS